MPLGWGALWRLATKGANGHLLQRAFVERAPFREPLAASKGYLSLPTLRFWGPPLSTVRVRCRPQRESTVCRRPESTALCLKCGFCCGWERLRRRHPHQDPRFIERTVDFGGRRTMDSRCGRHRLRDLDSAGLQKALLQKALYPPLWRPCQQT